MLIGAFAGVALFVVFLIWYPNRGSSSEAAGVASPQRPAAVTVDQADLSRYWSDNFAATSWYPLTAAPAWDGAAMVARTKLFADGDAREPALAICRAMVNYWGVKGLEFRPVRVLDQADAILASAHTAADSCAWRR